MPPERTFSRSLRSFLPCAPALGIALFGLSACSRAPLPSPAAQLQKIVLDYRYGWYHTANGNDTLASIAAQYKRDGGLVSRLNRLDLASQPPAGKLIYIPPNNDVDYVRRSLAVINQDPSIVPREPWIDPTPRNAPDLKEIVSAEKPEAELKTVSGPALASRPNPSPAPSTSISTRPSLAMARPALPPASSTRRSNGSPLLFDWPVAGKVVTPFSEGWNKACHGIEIAAQQGAPVAAARAGKVLFAREFPGYGRLILIDHGDGFASVYAYLDKMLVREGERVEQGRRIATVGQKGSSPLFFFQIRKQGELVDPMDFLKARQGE